MRFLRLLSIISVAAAIFIPMAAWSQTYTLGSGDKLRIIVYDEEDLSGEFEVDGSGFISLPLIGRVLAGSRTIRQLEDDIKVKLLEGYLRNPRVNAEVLSYRPFFIDGEIEKPGEYPYRAGLTVREAVAIAGGYKYWANKESAEISRRSDPKRKRAEVPVDATVQPGDHIWIRD